MAGAATILSLTTSISAFIPAGIWGFVLFTGLLLKFRPPLADTLYFFYPLISPLIPAIVGLVDYKNWFALVWVFGLMGLLIIDGWKADWKKHWVKTSYIPLLCMYNIVLIISLFANPMNEHALSYMLQTMATIPVYWLIVQSSTEYDLDRILKAFIIAAALNSLAFMVFFLYGTPQAALAGFIFGFLRPMVLGVNANLWPYPSLIAIPILIAYFVHKPLTWRDQMWFGAALVVVSAIVVIN
ncbi:hypothetical protein KKA00_07520, partial [bacterium]|nr:hypothetical protein [bacterium]